MSNRAPAENAISESSSQSVTTRLQAKKRVADTQPEDQDVEEGTTAKPPDLPAPEHHPSVAQTSAETGHTRNRNGKYNTTNSNESGGTSGIENAIRKAQEKVRKEEKEKDAMWGRIAKAVDVAMAAEGPGKVEDHQIEHIINAILGCRTLSKSQLQKQRRNTGAQTAITEEPQFQEVESPATTILPAKQETWANVAASKAPKKMSNKPTLSKPLQGARTDSRLMVRLGENSPHRNEHPFLLQKKANSVLPQGVVVGKVAHINTGIALIPTAGVTIQQLEEHSEKLARAFGACRAERNEKWVKYLVREVPRRIMTLDGLADVTSEMAEEAFEMSCGMRPEWGRWVIPQGKIEEEIIEANMIFAVRPQNVQSVPKVISLLGKMRVIVALPLKETPRQCMQCGEWTHKRENCAKRPRCFQCSSDRHTTEEHICLENECAKSTSLCPHPPKCIVCGGAHRAEHESCPLRPVYSKAKGIIRKPERSEIARIRGQQKTIRDRTTRDNQLQIEVAEKAEKAKRATLPPAAQRLNHSGIVSPQSES